MTIQWYYADVHFQDGARIEKVFLFSDYERELTALRTELEVMEKRLRECEAKRYFDISDDSRYARWIFVKHSDGIHWVTCAQMTQETWDMLQTMIAAKP